ncbi:MAG: 2-oxoacid:acceptor oxidoreductase family protein [Clostridia bacterium]|nr:2-oxoacid:acceptor oxidoreductase family protein [Clostridia bacterium]MBQ7048878.1 2-oxoacid:acceptor oxidoreductase family protein [Clostridia bacterium]
MSNILLAGFGGQGILFAGKQIVLAGMNQGKYVSWLPSYGPEMRGGTCNCSVIVEDEPIGSPLVTAPDVLLAFNTPSFDKFESTVVKGGMLFTDSSLVNKKGERDDINYYYIPATELANENGITGMANVIMLGYIVKKTGLYTKEYFMESLTSGIPASKAHLAEVNKKALEIGFGYEG